MASAEALIVVLSSSDVPKECFTTNDRAFASRPLMSAGKQLGYNFKNFGIAPYCSYWRNISKICSVQLFSSHRVESFRHVRAEEILTLIRLLMECWERDQMNPVDMKSKLSDLTYNIMMRIVASKDSREISVLKTSKRRSISKSFWKKLQCYLEHLMSHITCPFSSGSIHRV